MALTKIEWADYTWNPWRGCQKVSEGCKNCYAETLSARNPKVLGEWGPAGVRAIAAESYWQLPYRWDKEAQREGVRRRVFCLSLGDWLEDRHELVLPRARLLQTIKDTPSLDWMLLTKRPEGWEERLSEILARAQELTGELCGFIYRWVAGYPPANVWLGTSIEDQSTAENRIPTLLHSPARVRFLSYEPALAPVDLSCIGWRKWDVLRGWNPDAGPEGANTSCIDWVIVGGESGLGARPFVLDWARDIVCQCQSAGIPVFVKQLGSNPHDTCTYCDGDGFIVTDWNQDAYENIESPCPRCSFGTVYPKLKDPKGGNLDEWPEDLRIRQFPGSFAGETTL